MPSITDTPPQAIQDDLDALGRALDDSIPGRTDDNLLIATWNLRLFASLTRKWTAGANDSPKRDLRGLRAIIAILSRFDVVALQEVQGNLRALRDTMRFLGPGWGFLMTDVNIGDVGADERFVFLFNRARLRPSGLAAEIVIPPEQIAAADAGALHRQFVRPPYAVSFQRRDATFILVTLHVRYGNDEAERLPELNGIAQWMHDWARRSSRFHHNLLVLGDFNIDRRGSPGYEAFTSTGLRVPQALVDLPRSIFDDPGDPNDDRYYDQIAWFTSGSGALLGLQPLAGGNFDFMPHVYRGTSLSRRSISYRVSDHFPLWMAFRT